MIESRQVIDFLQQSHLFRDLSEEAVQDISGRIISKSFPSGQMVYRQGEEGADFYLVFSGKISELRKDGDQERLLAEIGPGECFGEESLQKKGHRFVTAKVKEPAVLLLFSHALLDSLVKQYPSLRARLEISLSSLRLLVRRRFAWLMEDEVVHFITQKHFVILMKSLLWPVMGLLLPALSLSLYLVTPSSIFLWVAALCILMSVVAGFWKWVDWGNDTYIVTSKRVLAIKKVILVYESRQEAPLATILSINSRNDVIGRAFGYGDVIIRTYVGNVTFSSINHPEAVEGLLHEFWKRAGQGTGKVDLLAWRSSLRQKMNLEQSPPPQEIGMDVKPARRPAYKFKLFKTRFEENGIITYRKHWFVLLKQTWLPGLLFLVSLVMVLRTLLIHGFKPSGSLVLDIFLVLGGLALLWWFYQVVDWSNDQFQVSEDEIFDIDRKPLGSSTRNVAPLGNILNMESVRKNPLQVLFNYGDVIISVGGSSMVFEDVMKPDEVQQDIEERRVALKQKVEREHELAERERLAAYIADYHDQAPLLNAEQEEKIRQVLDTARFHDKTAD